MIERFYMKDNLSFESVDLEFQQGLILFTGPSGAGKSVLMNGILGAIGQKDSLANLSEVIFNNSINLEEFGIEGDDITVFRQIRKGKLRYFINSQTVSKKVVSKIGKLFINHLNPRDIVEFDSKNLIGILDMIILSKEPEFIKIMDNFKIEFNEYENLNRELRNLENEISHIAQREEFIKFEISQIKKIAPKVGEYEELQLMKKQLSKKDRIENYIDEVQVIFNNQHNIYEIFDLMGMEKEAEEISNFYEDVKAKVEDIQDKLSELDDSNIEKILNRIEKISELRDKYSSIEKALEYRDSQMAELKKLAKLRKAKIVLSQKISDKNDILLEIASDISDKRGDYLDEFESSLNHYLSLLNLDKSELELFEIDFISNGTDLGHLKISDTDIEKLSYGEQNRVRLALLTLKTKFSKNVNGTLFLDEIDANLSGEESMKVAQVLKELSKVYQVFAVSHQPQLTSQADQHFLVSKTKGKSSVTLLDSKTNRAKEIVRMVGGEFSNQNVYKFAMSLLEK